MDSPGQDKEEFSDSDREWLRAVGGEAMDPDSPAAREGFALRLALEQRRREMEARSGARPGKSEEARQAQRDRLLQRARAEGLFERGTLDTSAPPGLEVAPVPTPMPVSPPTPKSAPPSNVIEFPGWRRRRALVALAASAVVGAVLVTQLVDRPDYAAPPEMLGSASVQRHQAVQARATAERLAGQLRAAGLRPGLYQRGRTYIVDIQLLGSELPAATPAFEALGIKPSPGFNRVEVAPG